MKGFITGTVVTLSVILIGVYLFFSLGYVPTHADAKPHPLEKWLAGKALRAAYDREVKPAANPLPRSEANLLAGVRLYTAHCLPCHGAADGNASKIARGLYQKPPQFAKHGEEEDPEEGTYWIIEHGIRFTGMPAFSGTLKKDEIWQISMFLKNMESLSPQAQKAWKALPSAGDPSSPAEKENEHAHDHDHAHHHKH